jgi:hypothetical protein
MSICFYTCNPLPTINTFNTIKGNLSFSLALWCAQFFRFFFLLCLLGPAFGLIWTLVGFARTGSRSSNRGFTVTITARNHNHYITGRSVLDLQGSQSCVKLVCVWLAHQLDLPLQPVSHTKRSSSVRQGRWDRNQPIFGIGSKAFGSSSTSKRQGWLETEGNEAFQVILLVDAEIVSLTC